MKYNLPPQARHQQISKDLIWTCYQKPDWQKYIRYDQHYQVCSTTMLVYDFSEQPLADQFQSAIIDQAGGLILCPIKPRRLFMNFMKNRLLNSYFQTGCRQALGYRNSHALSFGNQCFMSAYGHRAGKASDWVGLHYMRNYWLSPQGCCFQGPAGYCFLLAQVPGHFAKILAETVTHNCLARKFIQEAVAESGVRLVADSLLYQNKFVQAAELHEAQAHYSVSKLVYANAEKSLELYGRNFAREQGLPWSAQAHYLAKQAALRTRLFH